MQHFLKNETLCTTLYAKKYNLDPNTVRRHRKVLEKQYPGSITQVSKGCYKMLTGSLLAQSSKSIENMEDIGCILDISHIFNPGIFSIFDTESKKLINQLSSDVKTIYHVKQHPFEDLQSTCHSSVLALLKKAILHKQYMDITYETQEVFHYKEVKAFKIVFAEQNWYLATMHNDNLNNGFKWLRLSFIKDVTLIQAISS